LGWYLVIIRIASYGDRGSRRKGRKDLKASDSILEKSRFSGDKRFKNTDWVIAREGNTWKAQKCGHAHLTATTSKDKVKSIGWPKLSIAGY